MEKINKIDNPLATDKENREKMQITKIRNHSRDMTVSLRNKIIRTLYTIIHQEIRSWRLNGQIPRNIPIT